jgi:hypothetical protein
MSFIFSQITRRGIVMTADRCATGKATLERDTGLREDFCVTVSTTLQKIFATKNNIGISVYGQGTINKTSMENCLCAFLEQLDVEKYRTPYEVATHLKDYFWRLDQNTMNVFHVAGYDMTEKIPLPALYMVATKERIVSKINCDETYQGSTLAGMTGIAGRDGIRKIHNGHGQAADALYEKRTSDQRRDQYAHNQA